MSVQSEHNDYVNMKTEWKKCIDFSTSEKAVHGAGVAYLPALSDQDADEYNAYKDKAPCMMFSQRSGLAMTGMATRKEAVIEGSDLIRELLENIDSDQNDFDTYVSKVMLRFLFTGRSATLVDVPRVEGEITVLQAQQTGVRPRFLYYDEGDIINWRQETINNINTTVLVVLREEVAEVDTDDEFDWTNVYQYRVLDLVGDSKKVYRQRLFDDGGSEVTDSEVFPKLDGQFLDFIPIVFHGGIKPITPPLNSIVDINKHHYQLGADEMHGLVTAALPTPYFFGIDPNDKDFPDATGPARVIGADSPDCKTGYREYSGAGLESVANKLQKFEDIISMLSVQMTVDTVQGSATGSAIDYANSTATLSGVVNLLNNEFDTLIKIAGAWEGVNPDDLTVHLNKDFMPAGMSPQELTSLLQTYLSGGISYSTFYNNLAKGEIADPRKTPEEEKDEIEKELPPNLLGYTTGGEENPDKEGTGDNVDDGGSPGSNEDE